MKTFIRILSYTLPYKLLIILSFISSFFYGIFNALSLWVVGSLIGTIMGSKSDSISVNQDSNSFIQTIENYMNSIIANSDLAQQLKMVCILLFISFIFKNIFFYINSISLAKVQINVIRDIRNKLYKKVHNLSLSFFDHNRSGEIMSIMLNDVNMMSVTFSKAFQVVFHEFLSMGILLSMLFMISADLTLLVLLTFPVSAFIIYKIGSSIRRKATRASHKIADISSIMSEKILGMKIVKAFNMGHKEIKKFINKNYIFSNLGYQQAKLNSLTTPINDLIGVTLAAGLLWYGGNQVILNNYLTPDSFLRFIIFLFALLQPVRKLGNSFTVVQAGIASSLRVFNLLDIKDRIKNEKKLSQITSFNRKIKFQNVNFHYEKSKVDVLKKINITIEKGEKIALVGKSGSGKTTFSNLLMDFYQPSSGLILLDNNNYENINTNSLRELFGLVSQEPILFSGSIKDNIAYGLSNVDTHSIENASKVANIHDFIIGLDKQYESLIGERGTKLSGGQKQRLSIARAILKNPPLLIFDEATSSLDTESEQKVQIAIDNLIKDRTVFIIAHRLSTIKNVDRILVFEEGKIIEEGSHEELIKNNGLYTKLYQMQFKS